MFFIHVIIQKFLKFCFGAVLAMWSSYVLGYVWRSRNVEMFIVWLYKSEILFSSSLILDCLECMITMKDQWNPLNRNGSSLQREFNRYVGSSKWYLICIYCSSCHTSRNDKNLMGLEYGKLWFCTFFFFNFKIFCTKEYMWNKLHNSRLVRKLLKITLSFWLVSQGCPSAVRCLRDFLAIYRFGKLLRQKLYKILIFSALSEM